MNCGIVVEWKTVSKENKLQVYMDESQKHNVEQKKLKVQNQAKQNYISFRDITCAIVIIRE